MEKRHVMICKKTNRFWPRPLRRLSCGGWATRMRAVNSAMSSTSGHCQSFLAGSSSLNVDTLVAKEKQKLMLNVTMEAAQRLVVYFRAAVPHRVSTLLWSFIWTWIVKPDRHTHTDTHHIGSRLCHCPCASWWLGVQSGARSPQDYRAVRGRGEEGALVRVPPTLDHLVPVLAGQRLGEGLRQVTWVHQRKKNVIRCRKRCRLGYFSVSFMTPISSHSLSLSSCSFSMGCTWTAFAIICIDGSIVEILYCQQ